MPSASLLRSHTDFLKTIVLRIQKQTRRCRAGLVAWVEILDALGWSVALWLPDAGPILSQRALRWAENHSLAGPPDHARITACLATSSTARALVNTARLQIWQDQAKPGQRTSAPDEISPLTKREREVLGWLRAGKTGPEIAIILSCAPRTVETHVARIYRKLGVGRRTELFFGHGKQVSA